MPAFRAPPSTSRVFWLLRSSSGAFFQGRAELARFPRVRPSLGPYVAVSFDSPVAARAEARALPGRWSVVSSPCRDWSLSEFEAIRSL